LNNDGSNIDRGRFDLPKATIVALLSKAFVGFQDSQVEFFGSVAVRVS
jgi:hypothetical protein